MYHSVGFPEPFMVFDQVTVTVRTSEQFQSEFKTDLDLERLPSGKFDTKGSIPLLRTYQKRRLNTSKGERWSICLNVRFAT